MVIDKGKLIALLVDKTGRTKEEVENQLHELSDQILEAVQSGRQYHIAGFGTFGMEDGSLYFDPVKKLETEINQKYAGMKPIELMAAFKDSGAGVPVEDDEIQEETAAPEAPATPVADIPDEEAVPEEEPGEEPPEVSEPIEAEEEPTEDEQPAEELAEEHKKTEAGREPVEPEPEQEPEPEEEREERVAPAVAAENREEPDEAVSAAAAANEEDRRAEDDDMDEEEKDPLGTALLAAVVVIGLVVAGWLLYESGAFTTAERNANIAAVPSDTTGQPRQTPPPAVPDDTTAASAAVTDSAEQNGAGAVSESNSGQASAAGPYGLRGSLNEDVQNAYTIVIHSFRLQSTVQEIADSLGRRGYRTVIFDGTADGSTRWRLGLGQFETVDAAQQAVQDLTPPYRESHFIKRIQ